MSSPTDSGSTNEEFWNHLARKRFKKETIEKIKAKNITQKDLECLNQQAMECILDIRDEEERKNLDNFLGRDDRFEVINDPVHGHMEFHPLCIAIINTPEFQRLRDVKQLGAGYFVYPGAAHNRFEHSIGVCHLAGQLVSELKKHQPEMGITDKEVLCVQIAGLCHDLGHGPFSHMFDRQFIPAWKEGQEDSTEQKEWSHEMMSLKMFGRIAKKDKVKELFKKYNIDDSSIGFIKNMIHSEKEVKGTKAFLYEIVANNHNGVDVDKWEYFKRDCYNLGMGSASDHSRFMKFARVIKSEQDKKYHICVRDKEAFNMYQMFLTRQTLHRKACKHKTVMAIETMIVHGLLAANDHFPIPGKKGEMKISDCIHDPVAFTKLTDSIFYQILLSKDEKLKAARQWFLDIQERRQYKLVAETLPIDPEKSFTNKSEKKIKAELIDIIREKGKEDLLTEEEPYYNEKYVPHRFVVQMVNFDFGKKTRNPVDDIEFYTKTKNTESKTVKPSEVSLFLPQSTCRELVVRVFLRPSSTDDKDEQRHGLLEECFQMYCRRLISSDFKIKVFNWQTCK